MVSADRTFSRRAGVWLAAEDNAPRAARIFRAAVAVAQRALKVVCIGTLRAHAASAASDLAVM